jgi:hypothetical protein
LNRGQLLYKKLIAMALYYGYNCGGLMSDQK